MNERVEEVYEQMFAPKPVPASVRTLFDKANHLASRVDAQTMKLTDLAIIGAVAVMPQVGIATTGGAIEPPKEPIDEDGSIDTTEDTVAPSQGATAPPVDEVPVAGTARPSQGPTGPMDAPAQPPTPKTKSLTTKQMQKMTRPELIVHAKEAYGFSPPQQYRKPQIIAILKTRDPL
jgi:hypothetical protein